MSHGTFWRPHGLSDGGGEPSFQKDPQLELELTLPMMMAAIAAMVFNTSFTSPRPVEHVQGQAAVQGTQPNSGWNQPPAAAAPTVAQTFAAMVQQLSSFRTPARQYPYALHLLPRHLTPWPRFNERFVVPSVVLEASSHRTRERDQDRARRVQTGPIEGWNLQAPQPATPAQYFAALQAQTQSFRTSDRPAHYHLRLMPRHSTPWPRFNEVVGVSIFDQQRNSSYRTQAQSRDYRPTESNWGWFVPAPTGPTV